MNETTDTRFPALLTKQQEKELMWLTKDKPNLTFRQRSILARLTKPSSTMEKAFEQAAVRGGNARIIGIL